MPLFGPSLRAFNELKTQYVSCNAALKSHVRRIAQVEHDRESYDLTLYKEIRKRDKTIEAQKTSIMQLRELLVDAHKRIDNIELFVHKDVIDERK